MAWTNMPTIRQMKRMSGLVVEAIVDQISELTNRVEQVALKTSNETVTSSTVMQDDNELILTNLVAGAKYRIYSYIPYTAAGAASTSGFKMGWSAPSGATFDWVAHAKIDTDGSASAAAMWQFGGVVSTELAAGGAAAAKLAATPNGNLIMGSVAGSLTFRWAQNTSNATGTVVYANAALWAQRYA